jgi:hypothetical protein
LSFWTVVIIAAGWFAGPFTPFSCWQLAVLFPTPLAVVFWGGIATLLGLSLVRGTQYIAGGERSPALLFVPIHFVILAVGLSIEIAVAQLTYPKPSCL